jgi:hypothetical protein
VVARIDYTENCSRVPSAYRKATERDYPQPLEYSQGKGKGGPNVSMESGTIPTFIKNFWAGRHAR